MNQSTEFKMTRRERKVLSDNRAAMTTATVPESTPSLEKDLAKIVDLKHKHISRHGWVPGQHITKIHRFLLTTATELWCELSQQRADDLVVAQGNIEMMCKYGV